MSRSTLGFRTIEDLIEKKEKFYVPSYQRGYRWTRTQVRELLDDIWEFSKEKKDNNFYCLQPVVVTDREGEWELIDGQQRLTTIYIILYCLNQTKAAKRQTTLYSIRYDTRPGSEEFLKSIDVSKKKNNIDYFHMAEAMDEVDQWLTKMDSYVGVFESLLRNDTRIIWYDVLAKNETEIIDIFTRLNIGKIQLTDAELIKALFLRKKNLVHKYEEVTTLKQTQIAREWDEIEQTLRKDSFWYFITSDSVKYSSRIEFIFEVIIDKTEENTDDHHTFHEYTELFKSKTNDELWHDVKDIFMRLCEWYNDRELYHLIGFLSICGQSIKSLLSDSKMLSKNAFKQHLREIIKTKVDCDLGSLKYENPLVRKVLLLFNIETTLSSGNTSMRFPFDLYRGKGKSWDIEHIRAVKSQKPTIRSEQKVWIKSVLWYFTGSEIIAEQKEKLPQLDVIIQPLFSTAIKIVTETKWDDREFDDLYYKLLKYFGEDSEKEVNNNISNLALLDATTNRSYKNAVYPVKRKRILKNDNDGVYVPVCTKNVFLKHYSSNISDMMHWQDDDQVDYLKAMIETLSQYLTIN